MRREAGRANENERLRLSLATLLALAAMATFVWGGVSGPAAHYLGGLLLLIAASIGGYGVVSARLPWLRLYARKRDSE